MELKNQIEVLFNEEKNYHEVINILTDNVLKDENSEELFILRGNAWFELKEYDKAVSDYNSSILINPESITGYYNRGLVKVAQKKYKSAIDDCNLFLSLNPDSEEILSYRGSINRLLEDYDSAIEDYSKAININSDYANTYYTRGLTYYEKAFSTENNIIDIKNSKNDFEKYLSLTTDEKDVWFSYANDYIEELTDILKNPKLLEIIQLINQIKKILLVDEEPISHYTSLSTLKSLIMDNSKFRLSEGNYMNDPSEGLTFYNFLGDKPIKENSIIPYFSPKPFIGSFVLGSKSDDLNMWRFYGKENDIEAKGCSITMDSKKFIDKIKDTLSNEHKDRRTEDESDINFYWVTYFDPQNSDFLCSNDSIDTKKLKELMFILKEIFDKYDQDKSLLIKYLNNISFLFKNNSFKNENEIRLVIKGFTFKKQHNKNLFPPRVYIELETIKDLTKKITFGPKVDKLNEWGASLFYSYSENEPVITKSLHLFQ